MREDRHTRTIHHYSHRGTTFTLLYIVIVVLLNILIQENKLILAQLKVTKSLVGRYMLLNNRNYLLGVKNLVGSVCIYISLDFRHQPLEPMLRIYIIL